MDWILGDIVKTQGPSGLTPLFTPAPYPAAPSQGETDGHLPSPAVPSPVPAVPLPVPVVPPEVTLPLPKPAGMSMSQPVPAERPLAGLSTLTPVSGAAPAPAAPVAAAPVSTNPTPAPVPATNGKESEGWRLLPRWR
jgi:hypothetical protein